MGITSLSSSFGNTIPVFTTPKRDSDIEITDVSQFKLGDDQYVEHSGITQSNQEVIASDAEDKYQFSFHFDLLYQLHNRVKSSLGEQQGSRFVELTSQVTKTFESSFDVKIDPIGTYLDATKNTLDISPDVTLSFFDALDGLGELSQESLDRFLSETDAYFGDLKSKYGSLSDILDESKGLVKDQAQAFFQNASSNSAEATGNLSTADLFPADLPPETATTATQPDEEGLYVDTHDLSPDHTHIPVTPVDPSDPGETLDPLVPPDPTAEPTPTDSGATSATPTDLNGSSELPPADPGITLVNPEQQTVSSETYKNFLESFYAYLARFKKQTLVYWYGPQPSVPPQSSTFQTLA